ncbi:MAG TPA: 50S ribosomal protein L9 [Anaerolineae bacterium]|nr:50S ribosomal protein L9 [Anaerolineae bacterium]
MLLKDVYKLGRAGDVKKVADGYGRNYLIPQGLAVLATPGVMKQTERIRDTAAQERARLNQELGAVAERISGLELPFAVKAGDTGRLYGSITTVMIAEAIEKETGAQIERRQVDSQPIKMLGVHHINIRLTMDLTPEVVVIVHREGEPLESAYALTPEVVADAEVLEDFADLKAELEAEEAELEAEELAEVVDEEGASEEETTAEGSQEEISDQA